MLPECTCPFCAGNSEEGCGDLIGSECNGCHAAECPPGYRCPNFSLDREMAEYMGKTGKEIAALLNGGRI